MHAIDRKNIDLAARIADHMRQIGGTHRDAIRIIIKKGLAADAGEADALLYDADTIAEQRGRKVTAPLPEHILKRWNLKHPIKSPSYAEFRKQFLKDSDCKRR